MPGSRFDDIDGLIVNRIPDYQRFCEIAGIDPDYVNITPGQGRFSGIDIETAAALIRDGLAHHRRAGLRQQRPLGRRPLRRRGRHLRQRRRRQLVSLRHDLARRVPRADGAPPHGALRHDGRQLGTVSKTFRDHAALNPAAVMRKPFTLADYHASRYICEPLHLLDYCLINDGGVALILTTAERARDLTQPPVYLRGYGMATTLAGSMFPPDDFWRALDAQGGGEELSRWPA